jgi:crossover junction endodeoxyribonuclease RuvC
VATAKSKVILGIDPGTTIMGYGIIVCEGNSIKVLTHGVLMLNKLDDHFEKLKMIFRRITALIDEYKPDEVAAEAPFYGENVQSMLKLGRAQGVALAAALQKDLPVYEYAPRKIKMSITGGGNATKEQLALMMLKQGYITEMPKNLDATDGLAVALCHHYQNKNAVAGGKSYSNWESFVSQNNTRVKKQ